MKEQETQDKQQNPFVIMLQIFDCSNKKVLMIELSYYTTQQIEIIFKILFDFKYDFVVHINSNNILTLTK